MKAIGMTVSIRNSHANFRARDLEAQAIANMTSHTSATATGEVVPAWKKDRKSTRLNSSHAKNSYAVFCLKKKRDGIRRRAQHQSGGVGGAGADLVRWRVAYPLPEHPAEAPTAQTARHQQDVNYHKHDGVS